MGNPKAFLSVPRKEAGYRPVHDRVHDFGEVEQTLNTKDRQEQASRCMDCGVPFCHWACPLGNKDPEWNDALYHGEWETAYKILKKTNDFPEFTGRICPALCEKSCVLYLTTGEPVTNRENEAAIAERAFLEGYVTIEHPERNGKKVAIIGGGPAGLAAANQLNYRGYEVTVFDKQKSAGGLLRYGIPNFKLNKKVIDRRLDVMQQEGVKFVFGCNCKIEDGKLKIEKTLYTTPEDESSIFNLQSSIFDAYIIATGTPQARDLNIPGRELKGVHLALELLSQQNQVLMGEIEFDGKGLSLSLDENQERIERVTCKGKNVLVIGGGDTGSDCIGTAHRQGALSVTQIEIMPKPPVGHNDATPWPNWPVILKTTSSHEEGCERRWNINTLEFLGDKKGNLTGVRVQPIDWEPNPNGGRPNMVVAGPEEVIKAEIVFLAMGFLKPQHPEYPKNVFLAGDTASGASLVVRAIASGRKVAEQVDRFLK